MIICSVVSLSAMVLTYKMSQTTSNITKTCNKCTNCIKTIKATTQFVVFLFVHSWEQRKAKELCSISTGKSNTQDQVDDGKYPFYIRSDIPVRSNKYLYDCEAVITIGDGNIGKVFHYVNGKFDLHQRCYKMTDFQDIWGKYFFYYFSTKFYDRAMKMTAKATVDSVRLEMISEMDIKQPFQISEQKQIAEFFDYLNNLITLHQREFFRLILAFFCCNSTSILPISWEQRKLGELALFNPKDALPQTFEYVDLESVVGTEMLSHRTEVKSSAPSRAQRLAHTGDLFYQTVRPYQKNNYLFEKPDNNYVFSTGYAQMRPYVDGYFLLSLVQSEHFVKVVLDNCTGTSYPAINANDLAEIEVTAPSDESEAQKIGTIFRNIDNLITLHQCECLGNSHALSILPCPLSSRKMTSFWEQRKLGDVATEMVAGGDIDKDLILNEGRYPVIANALTNDGVVGYYNEDYRIKAPAVTVTGRGDVGHAKARIVDFTPVVRLLSVKSNHDIFFLENAINTLKIVIESTGVPQLTVPQLAKYEISFPKSLDEEEKIGTYFRNLDNLITLHQRECLPKTCSLASWFYQQTNRKMTSFWEQRKLGDVAIEMIAGGDIDKGLILEEGRYPVIANALTNDGIVGYYNNEFRIKAPAVTITGRGDVGHAKARIVDFTPVVRLLTIKSKHDVFFLENAINTLKIVIESTGVPQLTVPQLEKYEVVFPKQLAEEEKIGAFFKQLDNLITLHQCKDFSLKSVFEESKNFISALRKNTSWEQRKFSELVLIERGGSPRPIDDYITDAPDGLNWVKIGDAPTQGHYITKTAEKIKPEGLSKTRQVQPGDLILSNSMSFGKPYIMAINGCIHDGWLLIRDTNNVFDLTFLCHLLGTTQMLGQYKQFAAGSTVNNLNKELVGNTIVTIPSKPEQKVLGEYFESIDNLITLHQRIKIFFTGDYHDQKNK